MFTKIRNSYHNASQRAHHHTAVLVLGLTMIAVAFGWQFGSYFMGQDKTYAAEPSVPYEWCDTQEGSGFLQIPLDECYILADIYVATDGDNWYNIQNNSSPWFQGDGSNICRFRYGIGNCEWDMNISKYRITGINLDNNNLSGMLPSSFYNLPRLQWVNIQRNYSLIIDLDILTASPYLENFRSFNAANNTIYGNINNFINLINIEYLDIGCYRDANLDNCTATGDTSFVPSLEKLYGLKLGGHTGITFDLSDLETSPNLREVYALNNYIIGDVSSLSGATGMQFLDIGCWYLLNGECDVTGNLNFLQNMNNLNYLSMDALRNIEGTLDVLYDKTQLTQIDLSHNRISGTIGTGIGNLTQLTVLDIEDNLLDGVLPQEMYNLNMLNRFKIGANREMTGALLQFHTFSSLEELNIGDTNMDYSNVRDMVTPPTTVSPLCNMANGGDPCIPTYKASTLRELNIDKANIGGQIPDIWNKFPSLVGLYLQFNNLTGPFPDSFGLLTNLTDLQIRFNNLDGDIPVYFSTMSLDQGKFAIEANCLNTDVSDPDLLALLTNYSPAWNNQLNCRANIKTSSEVVSAGLGAGQCGMYTIHYQNLGPQKAINLNIGQAFGSGIVASGSTPAYETGLVGRVYATAEDPCYIQATQYATGPYFAEYENLLINESQYPFNSIYELATLLGGYLSTDQFTGTQGTTEFAYVLDKFCPFVFGTTDHYLCLLLFGMDLKEIDDPSCGVGGNPGYIRKLGTVPAYESGSIQVELCNEAQSIQMLSCTDINVDTISTNENQDICSISIESGYCGDDNVDEGEQCDDGNQNNNDGCSSQCTFEIPQTCGLSGNLVPNPGFESYLQCPTYFGHFTGYLASWYSPSPDADYIHMSCPFGSGMFDAFDQYPHASSSGAAHILTYASNIPGAGREYIGAELVTPMQIGKTYDVGFCYATNAISNYISDKIGIFFSTGSYPTNTGWNAIVQTPQFEHTGYIVGTGWTCVSGTVYADKAYERFTIGSFHTNSGQSIIANPMWNPEVAVPSYDIASYLIDDVFVSEACDSAPTPTPYCGDGSIDEGEQCDDGVENGQEPSMGEISYGASGSIIYCSDSCTNLSISYQGGYCGDKIVNGSEQCDGSNNCNSGCITVVPPVSTPTPTPYCGDDVVNGSEQCDGGVNCNTNCTLKSLSSRDRQPIIMMDVCPDGDFSVSYYDNDCGIGPSVPKHGSADEQERNNLIDRPIEFTKVVASTIKSMQCNIGNELVQGYVFAFDLKITTVNDICKANLQVDITREEFAKFISTYAIAVLGKKPDTKRSCSFSDVSKTTTEMQTFARISCELNIMGLKQNGDPDITFRPKDPMKRAEVFTALNRLVNGTVDNSETGVRYLKHMNRLVKQKVISDITNPQRNTLRGEVILMLMRAYNVIKNR